MSLYNMLFGKNPQTAMLLAVLGLRENDVERFRDVSASADGSAIEIYTRTGGGNRESYPNLAMRKLAAWAGSADDDYDSTYCNDTFVVPDEWRDDVAKLGDLFTHGMRAEFAQHLAKTLRREPTDDDKETAAYEAEASALARTKHFKANGHTFVPMDDHAMKTALELAEANGGKLRSCWGIAPITLIVKEGFFQWPNATDADMREAFTRAEINYDYGWSMDVEYWAHCQRRFGAKYPLTMANVAETVVQHQQRAAKDARAAISAATGQPS
jgi:hypothetical protein